LVTGRYYERAKNLTNVWSFLIVAKFDVMPLRFWNLSCDLCSQLTAKSISGHLICGGVLQFNDRPAYESVVKKVIVPKIENNRRRIIKRVKFAI
jgi:hypothetical protein